VGGVALVLVWARREKERVRMSYPVKEQSRAQSRPGETFALFAAEVLYNLLLLVEGRQQLQDRGVEAIDRKFGGEEAFHARFDGSIDVGFLIEEGRKIDGADDGILALEGGD